jgi:hypothetical protein
LHLNHFQEDLAWVCEAVHLALGDVNSLVLSDRLHLVADGHLGRSLDAIQCSER